MAEVKGRARLANRLAECGGAHCNDLLKAKVSPPKHGLVQRCRVEVRLIRMAIFGDIDSSFSLDLSQTTTSQARPSVCG